MLDPLRFVFALFLLAVPLSACADARQEGQQVFSDQCALCHDDSRDQNKLQGPPLFGVVGRKAGSVAGFGYSEALKRAGAKGMVWDEKTLDAYLASPQKAVPGSAMPVSVANAGERKVVIAYLKSLNGEASAKTEVKAATASSPDWRQDAPGVRHHVTVADLPAPYATSSAFNSPGVSGTGAPKVPQGFAVSVFADNLQRPRQIRTAPNGDLFVTVAGAGRILVYRNNGGRLISTPEVFASDLNDPFGVSFYPASGATQFVYISSPTSVSRMPYSGGAAQVVVANLSTGGGHSSRDIAISPDGRYLYVAVGSGSNIAEGMGGEPSGWVASHALGEAWGNEAGRAMVLRFDIDGKNRHVVATGIRNCVGLAFRPGSNDLYCAVNERDGLGDDLVPDYFTRVQDGAYYGWPWFYLGDHQDPRHDGKRGDLKGHVTLPDVLFQSHSAPLGFAFYAAPAGAAGAFPAAYQGDAFVALHGSWNRDRRTGSKVVRVLMKAGKPTGEYEDFLTGLVIDDHTVAGRPVGIAVGPDGALYISDDAAGKVWRVVKE